MKPSEASATVVLNRSEPCRVNQLENDWNAMLNSRHAPKNRSAIARLDVSVSRSARSGDTAIGRGPSTSTCAGSRSAAA